MNTTSERAHEPWLELVDAVPACWRRADDVVALPDEAGRRRVTEAVDRWRRLAPLLAALFPRDAASGVIESPLLPLRELAARHASAHAPAAFAERVFVKADHALPLAGSIKARGGIYAVLCLAERIAVDAGVLAPATATAALASPEARRFFSTQQLIVGSTGNLGFAVGLAGCALGFHTIVHMSHDAKTWKKARLRALGVEVVEHAADYSTAVTAARAAADSVAHAHFIDDEHSEDLFFGYSAAAHVLARQLGERGLAVTAERPLCLYLPCGVGGAPGGVLYGLRALLGPHVWGFFAEPTAAPCMMMRLMGAPAEVSVYDIGLDNRTIADGLAVGRASDYAFATVGAQIMGAFTVADAELLTWLAAAHDDAQLRLEPSAAAGFPGAMTHIWQSPVFAAERDRLAQATHVIWTTGGSLLPDEEFQALLAQARRGVPGLGSP